MDNLILEGILEAKEIKRGEDGRLRFKGLALRPNTISANKWFYGENMVRDSVERTNAWIAEGNICTMYSTHGKALGSMFSLPTESPIGKCARFYLENNVMVYEAQISPTDEGKDMMTLIEDGVVVHTSIRSNMFEAEPMTMSIDGEEVEVMNVKWAIINGVDFCDQPGVAGAGIIKVMESAPAVINREKQMEYKDLTLEALRSERPDLFNAVVVEHLALFQGQIESKDAEIAALKTELETLREAQVAPEKLTEMQSRVDTAVSALAEAQAELAVWEEVAVPLVRKMVELRKAQPDALLEQIRVEAIASLAPAPVAEGPTDEPENDSLEITEGAPAAFEKLIAITSKLGH